MELQHDEAVVGEVTAIKPYGAFVRLVTGDQGMIHISEISTEYVRDISQYLTVGQKVVVKVIGRNEEGKYNLSLKRVSREDHDAALFHNEVTQVKKALDERLAVLDESVKELIARRERRPARESLAAWIASMKREKSELERHQQWRMRFYAPDWQQLAENAPAASLTEGPETEDESDEGEDRA
ncbi:MAG: S1 RNA-binding domain-containing protein [Candidatus Bipolaricaulia bacterium]